MSKTDIYRCAKADGADPVVEPEVLPAAPDPRELPAWVTPESRTLVSQIVTLQDQIEESVQSFAQTIVLCGFGLIALKTQIQHGQWMDFCRDHLERPGFSYDTIKNYIRVAKAVRRKLKMGICSHFDPAHLLPAHGEEATEDELAPIREAIADMTDATTWHQLFLDFGLIRERKARGGDHGGGKARAALYATPEDMRRAQAADEWPQIIRSIREFVLHKKLHTYLTQAELQEGRKAIADAMQAIAAIKE